MKSIIKREEGQSIIIVALALVVLVALLGLVADAGNAYLQKRKYQNAMDAASEAGGLALGLQKNEGQIKSAIDTFLFNNGVDYTSPSLHRYYVVQNASGNRIVTDYSIPYIGVNSAPPQNLTWPRGGGSSLPVVGVNVQGNFGFPTFFAGVIGQRNLSVGGGSSAYVNSGLCNTNNLLPLAVSFSTFPISGGVPLMDFDMTHSPITLTEDSGSYSANRYGFLTWSSGATGPGVLQTNFTRPLTNQSGNWAVNDNVPNAENGTVDLSDISSVLSAYRSSGDSATVVIFDSDTGGVFHIKGFARMVIAGYRTTSPQALYVRFIRWDSQNGQGGCLNFGDVPVGNPPPPVPTPPPGTQPPPNPRVLVGQVKLNKLTGTHTTPVTTHVPVDVINVLDISGSMDAGFGSTTKLRAAKNALTSFNNNMQPSQGDQVGLVTFPLLQSGSGYNYSCTHSGSYSTYYYGQVRSFLTSNIAGVNSIINGLDANGGTSLADAIRLGRTTVLGAGHQSNHPAVMIVASDGIANIRLSGQWTGFQGDTYDNVSCNQQSVTDAINQANTAKSDGNGDNLPDVTIYSIAVGDDFNDASLKAIASVDTDPAKPHYFRATDPGSMSLIYTQIASRTQTIGQESCSVIPTEDLASGASIVVRNLTTGVSYNLTTNQAGDFFLEQPAPGTYQFQSATVTVSGLTYNVFTDGVGGATLTQNPTVTIPIGSGTYKYDLSLDTTQSPCD